MACGATHHKKIRINNNKKAAFIQGVRKMIFYMMVTPPPHESPSTKLHSILFIAAIA